MRQTSRRIWEERPSRRVLDWLSVRMDQAREDLGERALLQNATGEASSHLEAAGGAFDADAARGAFDAKVASEWGATARRQGRGADSCTLHRHTETLHSGCHTRRQDCHTPRSRHTLGCHTGRHHTGPRQTRRRPPAAAAVALLGSSEL